MKKSMLTFACIAVAGSAAMADTTIETFSAWSGGSISSFGEPDAATMGQTFICPADSHMVDFTFMFDDGPNPDFVDFEAYVYAWDGSKATGPALHASGPYSTTDNGGNGGWENLTFSTNNLSLTPGGAYVAFVCTSNLFDGENGFAALGAVNGYDDGEVVYMTNGDDFGLLTTKNWESGFSPTDLAFEMNFATIPAPGAGVVLGLGGLASARRRR
jgi:hypothetical protein